MEVALPGLARLVALFATEWDFDVQINARPRAATSRHTALG